MLSTVAVALLAASVASGSLAPVRSFAADAQLIEGSYIIRFRDDAASEFAAATVWPSTSLTGHSLDIQWRYVWEFGSFMGLAADLNEEQLLAVRALPGVEYVEVDGNMEIDVVPETDNGRQDGATWGLDRVDQDKLPLDQTYYYDVETQGKDVYAYILDTGIHTGHEDFNGRAEFGSCHPSDDVRCDTDCQSHGTHVAGTVGSTTYGVAKEVTLVAVKVCQGCGGSCRLSEVINGIDWSIAHHKANAKKKLSVLNMSLGYSVTPSLNAAINNAAAEGVVPVVSAGNSNNDACRQSPASAEDAVTVGATTITDARSSFSSYGPCAEIWGPGSNIVSLRNADSGTSSKSGTSMSSPHVCGLAALLVSESDYASSEEVKQAIIDTATNDVLSGLPSGSHNRMMNTRPPNRP